MDRRKNLVALDTPQAGETPVSEAVEAAEAGATAPAPEGAEQAFAEEWAADEWAEDEAPAGRSFTWLLPTLALLTVAGWTGFFGWSNSHAMLASSTPQQWIGWIGDWSLPVVLVIGLWLLAMRHSTREATRFGAAAQTLSNESSALEQRLSAINRELSLARDFIASQSRDLESLGRIAVERLSANAAQLQDLIRNNGDQVSAIGQVSDSALANMDRLRDQLPVLSNATRDLANQIGHAGHTAQGQLDEMVAAFLRLNEFGEASGRQLDALRQREDDALGQLAQRLTDLREMGAEVTSQLLAGQETARHRWNEAAEQLHARMADVITRISQLDEAAIGNARTRMDALAAAGREVDQSIIASATVFEAEFARRRAASATAETDALEALQHRLANFDSQTSERQQAQIAHMASLAMRGEALASRLTEFDREVARLAAQGSDEATRLGETSEMFAEKLSQSRAILEESGTFVSRLTDDSVRLLEIIRASADYSEGALSDSIGVAEQRLSQFETHALALRDTMTEAESRGSALLDHVTNTSAQSATSLDLLAQMETRLAAIAAQATTMSVQAQGDLQAAIAALEAASGEALSQLRDEQSQAVRDIAARIGAKSSEAIESALRDHSRAAIAELEQAAHQAAEQGRNVASQLRDQLSKVNQLAGNLENRVAQARARAEEQVDSDFTRRMALITESLNSSSIDIAKAFDAEVSDTAWASYLRGDRGIFTRRAVRLLDNGEARAVADVYETDPEVREAINRYIHDFEALLRTVLSTRDGNALAVTMLSSDIGKLYVALAQAIERLRD